MASEPEIRIEDESGDTRLAGSIFAPSNTPSGRVLKTGANGVTSWGTGGGGQIGSVVTPIAFNTPNILTGIVIYSGKVGDVIQVDRSCVSVTIAWNGTTPKFQIQPLGDPPGQVVTLDAAAANTSTGATGLEDASAGAFVVGTATLYVFTQNIDLMLLVDDGGGGDPGSTQGAGEVVVVVNPA